MSALRMIPSVLRICHDTVRDIDSEREQPTSLSSLPPSRPLRATHRSRFGVEERVCRLQDVLRQCEPAPQSSLVVTVGITPRTQRLHTSSDEPSPLPPAQRDAGVVCMAPATLDTAEHRRFACCVACSNAGLNRISLSTLLRW